MNRVPHAVGLLADRLKLLPPRFKLLLLLSADVAVLLLALFAARALRVPLAVWPPEGTWTLHLPSVVFSVIALALLGLYRSAARGHSMRLEMIIALSQALAAILWLVYLQVFSLHGFPRSLVGIYPVFATVLLTAERRLVGMIMQASSAQMRNQQRTPVFVYGVGQQIVSLAAALQQAGQYRVAAFITTDYTLVGRRLSGLRVYDTSQIAEARDKHGAKQVLIAGAQTDGPGLRQIFELMVRQGLSTKIVPNINDIAAGKVTSNAIRSLNIVDLLGRNVVDPQASTIENAIRNRIILVTGAGGSIGSEIVRQCARFGAKRIVLVESSEFALFEIQREMEGPAYQKLGTEIIALLADVKNPQQIAEVFAAHPIDTVFHAAAYKHVRIVQENAAAGIRNNVVGTVVVAQAAKAAGVQRFVLISTDKAVRPTSIMGASKRVAEMVLQGMASEAGSSTLFCMVRFGNVLGSSGSVVPIFANQIANGGPVTVTHPEVTRYFMAIPEAAELVLQAAGLARSGEVMVLDMGEPVKISKLARNMIELAGHTVRSADAPEGDIEIIFTGLKPGEKLYEELEIGNDLSPTSHPRILSSNEFSLPRQAMVKNLKMLQDFLDDGNVAKAVELVMYLAAKGPGNASPRQTT